MATMVPHFTNMAVKANWTDVNVKYRFATRDDTQVQAQSATPAAKILFIFVVVMILLGVVGTVIELTKLGDVSNIDYKKLEPV